MAERAAQKVGLARVCCLIQSGSPRQVSNQERGVLVFGALEKRRRHSLGNFQVAGTLARGASTRV